MMKFFIGIVIDNDTPLLTKIKKDYEEKIAIKAIKYLEVPSFTINEIPIKEYNPEDNDIIGCNITKPAIMHLVAFAKKINITNDFVTFIAKKDNSNYTSIPVFMNEKIINTRKHYNLTTVNIKNIAEPKCKILYDFLTKDFAIYENDKLIFGTNIEEGNMNILSIWDEYNENCVDILKQEIKEKI